MTRTEKTAVPTLQRGLEILEYLGNHSTGLTIAELVEQLGYPSASVFRITQELTTMGYLVREPASRRFTLTNKFLLLGRPGGEERGLVEASLGAMRRLHKETGETVQLCCLLETQSVILEQLISTHPFKYSGQLGARCPAFSCAPGKAIIAALPEDEQSDVISRIRFKKYTPTTLSTPAAFKKELLVIREQGFAVDRSEGLLGIHCVAAAICDRSGLPVGAITIAGPESRIPESEFPHLGQLISELVARAAANYQN